MPAAQNGRVDRPPSESSWRARWSDEHGKQRSKRGFETKTLARKFVNEEVKRVEKLRRGERVVLASHEVPTLQQLVDEFLLIHSAEANTIKTLTERLRYATRMFGDVQINRLAVPEIAAWRKRLPAGSAWGIHKALRQVLTYAVKAGYIQANQACEVPNPEPKRQEVPFFDFEDEVESIAAEVVAGYRAIPIFAADTGLRPEEWIALERRDIEIDRDRMTGIVKVRRVFTAGVLKPYGKQQGSLRIVGITGWGVRALLDHPPRLDTQLLFPAHRGGYINLHAWRGKHWTPAVWAAGLHVDAEGRRVRRTPYTLRHTYAAWAISARIDTFTLARRMGTSVEQIQKTYGHLLANSVELETELLSRSREARMALRKVDLG